MVLRIARPAVTGATLPGRDKAHIAFTPSRRAASKSTPADVAIGFLFLYVMETNCLMDSFMI